MVDDLDEIFQRLDFCKKQIVDIQQPIAAYVRSAVIYRQDTSKKPFHRVMVSLQKTFPVFLLEQVGQIVNSIRSCLDVLVSTLAVRENKSSANVYFPLWENKVLFSENAEKQLKKLSADNRQKIISLQTHAENNPRLFGFHRFDTSRKHKERLPLGTASQCKINVVELAGGLQFFSPAGQLRFGQEVCILESIPAGPEEYQFYSDAIFLEPPQIAQLRIVDGLHWFESEVRGIVTLFI